MSSTHNPFPYIGIRRCFSQKFYCMSIVEMVVKWLTSSLQFIFRHIEQQLGPGSNPSTECITTTISSCGLTNPRRYSGVQFQERWDQVETELRQGNFAESPRNPTTCEESCTTFRLLWRWQAGTWTCTGCHWKSWRRVVQSQWEDGLWLRKVLNVDGLWLRKVLNVDGLWLRKVLNVDGLCVRMGE